LTFAQASIRLGTPCNFLTSESILIWVAGDGGSALSGAALDAFRGVETQVVVRSLHRTRPRPSFCSPRSSWLRRKILVEAPAAPTPILRAFNLLTRPRFAFGTMLHLSLCGR